MTEATPSRPENEKGATRAAMSQKLLDAHARGDVEVVIGRAADLVGPGVTASAMGEFVFGRRRSRARRRRPWAGPTPRTPTATRPTSAATSCSSAADDEAYGRAWHLPNPETLTTREVITKVFEAAGRHAAHHHVEASDAARARADEPQRPRAARHLLPVRRAVRRRRPRVQGRVRRSTSPPGTRSSTRRSRTTEPGRSPPDPFARSPGASKDARRR